MPSSPSFLLPPPLLPSPCSPPPPPPAADKTAHSRGGEWVGYDAPVTGTKAIPAYIAPCVS